MMLSLFMRRRLVEGDRSTIARPHRAVAVCWNDPANNEPAAAALGRRVRQVTTALANAGWTVDVIFRASHPARAIDPTVRQSGRLRAIPVAGPGLEPSHAERFPIVRMLATYWYARTLGDRSGRWAQAASRALDFDRPDARPTAMIAFFTPRGPLAVAADRHRALGVPWIADLQDPIDEGASAVARPAVVAWMRKTLRSASRVVQVSPEWASASAECLNRTVDLLRHAVPNPPAIAQSSGVQADPLAFTILYAGSLNFEFQSATTLLRALDIVNREQTLAGQRRLVLRLASTRDSFERLSALAGAEQRDTLQYAGWLSQAELGKSMQAADALVLIPWSGAVRQVVPSKLFEYLAYKKPILVAGHDSGGVRRFLSEVQHPDVVAERIDEVAAVMRAMLRGDYSRAMTLGKCALPPHFDSDVQRQYVSWMNELSA